MIQPPNAARGHRSHPPGRRIYFRLYKSYVLRPYRNARSRNIKECLEFLYEQPLFVAYIGPVILLERIDTLPRNERVQHVLFLELATIHRLVAAFDLDSDRRLAFFADRDLFVISFNGGAVGW